MKLKSHPYKPVVDDEHSGGAKDNSDVFAQHAEALIEFEHSTPKKDATEVVIVKSKVTNDTVGIIKWLGVFQEYAFYPSTRKRLAFTRKMNDEINGKLRSLK